MATYIDQGCTSMVICSGVIENSYTYIWVLVASNEMGNFALSYLRMV